MPVGRPPKADTSDTHVGLLLEFLTEIASDRHTDDPVALLRLVAAVKRAKQGEINFLTHLEDLEIARILSGARRTREVDNKQIARVLGVTPGRVSQRHSDARRRLADGPVAAFHDLFQEEETRLRTVAEDAQTPLFERVRAGSVAAALKKAAQRLLGSMSVAADQEGHHGAEPS
ncbi:hypothetical protein N5079_11105 [Planotetraspora sp. A-T 1434]|uniref:hypothetical protein n=1 Tax=Planotetraspora sp. A-T 1434 TaxID=2979219 RepID=UPI0021C1FFE0|nr:hypothetical protein [Planotetraspora sp. A-T 1434]MCT9930765.1 hypothetical protein [Planotetraspora sp. A-T 1434]